MKEQFTLTSSGLGVSLRAISEADLENLRQWKNAHRFVFFYQEIIAPEQQAKWFQGYLERAHDYMFVVQNMTQAIGCMGFRLLDQHADIYNVILGRPEISGKGLMSQAMRLLCGFIVADFTCDIGAQVLLSNPARGWYWKNAFREARFFDTYVQVQLDLAQFQACAFQKV